MLVNKSMVDTHKTKNTNSVPQSPRTAKPDMGYSKIFHIKQQTARKTVTNTSISQPTGMNHMYKT